MTATRVARLASGSRACARALWVSALTAAACSSPPPPVIPGRETIGPPREAAAECDPTRMFAQTWFVVADLDQGISCRAFVEQDECIVALFRDCTDAESDPPRSWQGTINARLELELFRTREATGSIDARSPSSCEGDLIASAAEPEWAKLGCKIAGSAQPPHLGLYLEREPGEGQPPVPGPGTRGAEITVARPPARTEDYVSDLVFLASRGELFATVNAGRTDPASGLYAGASTASELHRLDDVVIPQPTAIAVDPAGQYLAIADGSRLVRVDTSTRGVRHVELGGELILDLVPAGAGVLVASEVLPRPSSTTRLTLRRFDTLEPIATATVAGVVVELVEVAADPSRIAFLRLREAERLVPVSADLATLPAIELPEIPGPTIYIGVLDAFVTGFDVPPRLVVWPLSGRDDYALRLPEAGPVESLAHDPVQGRVIVGTRGGLVTAVDLVGQRPLLQSRLQLDANVSRIARDPGTGALFLLRGAAGFIDPLTP